MKTVMLLAGFFILASQNPLEMQKDKKLIVKEIEHKGAASLKEVSTLLEEQTELNSIGVLNWEAFAYAPKVQFRIARNKNDIWLKYYVTEDNILAKHTDTNSAVSKDSCVEFFFDPLGNGNYYNFEINCIGTIHLAYGSGRNDRKYVDPMVIQKYIKAESSLGNRPFAEKTGGHTWEMTIVISAEAMTHNKGISLKGLSSKSNFYKCGDDTSQKHYITWNPIKTAKPDYHRPEYFGDLVFE
ncbi:Carbohydrate-binding family 9 [Pricia antarctica]|uniref:Carbohydrate-binding family 9 n=1 Tax=Pricia antarctica TaxID=641691 RepID=A0A1G7FCU6_9FLAO|nr:carbohydrate-binding family 9-like protein [Pricia antarctica]SDE73751.1 Carbohydrate-binding family 9 [Pricia antarctica]